MSTMQLTLFVILLVAVPLVSAADQPHIIYILADDLGWADVSWHDSSMITPNIQKLADEGVILDNFYVQTVCSPTRSSLMSGYYASNVGSQHFVFTGDRPHGLPLNVTNILPQALHGLGYSTYAIGKWHLGFCNQAYLPTSRGFDKFFGFYKGATDYYMHNSSEWGTYKPGKYNGQDLHEDTATTHADLQGEGYDGIYNSDLFRDKIQEYIQAHKTDSPDKPMFLYLALQQPHSPVAVPQEWYDKYPNITDEKRRTYSGQVTLMDTMVGEVVTKLKDVGMYDDSLIIFHSDNGADTRQYASNWPLRGNKGTYFEGALRVIAFVHGKGIEKTGYTNKGLFHVSDMFPTLIESVAGGTVNSEPKIDGLDIWQSLSEGKDSPRKEMLITIDDHVPDFSNTTAIRYKNWKLIIGYPAFRNGFGSLGWFETPVNGINELPAPEAEGTDVYLFDLDADPYEEQNIASEHPIVVKQLTAKIDKHRGTAWTFFPDPDPDCDPADYGGFWATGWC